MVAWNRYGTVEQICDQFERDGGVCLIAENAYIRGRHEGGDYYAIAKHAHNGRGQWYVGGPERWLALDTELKPWRTEGDHILVAPNRSFGMRGMVMPLNWADDVTRRLQAVTKRPIRIRHHPGNFDAKVPLIDDLENAWAVVIWSSSVGVRALIEGIPVICEGPYWICKRMTFALESFPRMDAPNNRRIWDEDRLEALERLAWGQWSVSEIAEGLPFRYLLSHTEQAQSAVAV